MLKLVQAILGWFGALLRSCPKSSINGTTTTFFHVIGHRGSPSVKVENTMESFCHAVEVDGANGLELDLCMTSDGQLVIWHDWDPDGLNARARESGLEPSMRYRPAPPQSGPYRKRISQLTLQEFREHFGYVEIESGEPADAHLPTLDEFLEWSARREDLELVFFDVKIPEDEVRIVPRFIDELDRLMDAHRPLHRFVIETTEPDVLRAMKGIHPEYKYTLDVMAHPGLVLFIEDCSCMTPVIEHGNTFATPQRPRRITIAPWVTYRRIVEQDLKKCAEYNRQHPGACVEAVVGFTLNDEKEMECLINAGIHGIQTDHPLLLRTVAERLGKEVKVPKAIAGK